MNAPQKELAAIYKKEKWEYWPPLVIFARLAEEVGEFARVLNKVYGKKRSKKNESAQDIEDELGDILYTLACFASSHGLDIDKALQKSIDKVHKKKKDLYNIYEHS